MKKYTIVVIVILMAVLAYWLNNKRKAWIAQKEADEARMAAMNQPAYRRGALNIQADRNAEISANTFDLFNPFQ